MTPLELLAVGVIVVLVWYSGAKFEHDWPSESFFTVFPLLAGIVAIFVSIVWLGIKEAAK